MKSRQIITHCLVGFLCVAAAWRWAVPVPPPGVSLERLLPTAAGFRRISLDPPMWAGETDGRVEGYVILSTANGYGGPMVVSSLVDPQGKILGVEIVSHKDTAAFIRMLENQYFMERFKGIELPRAELPLDMDGISGATYSSRGVTEAVHSGARILLKTRFNLDIPRVEKSFQWGGRETAILILVGIAALGIWSRKWKWRWMTWAGGLVFLGFIHNTPLSVSGVISLALGFFPDIHTSLGWYLMVPGVLIACLVLGKNHYCQWLCPFGAFQEFTARMGGGKWCCSKKLNTALSRIKYGVTFAVVLAGILLVNPGMAGFEPFAPLFALQGAGIQWYILPAVVFASFFIHRFWCRYFCPVGVILGLVARYGVKIRKTCPKSWASGVHIMEKQGD